MILTWEICDRVCTALAIYISHMGDRSDGSLGSYREDYIQETSDMFDMFAEECERLRRG
jgi:hypothetical protein